MIKSSSDLTICPALQKTTAITAIQARIASGMSRRRFHFWLSLLEGVCVSSRWRFVDILHHSLLLIIYLHASRTQALRAFCIEGQTSELNKTKKRRGAKTSPWLGCRDSNPNRPIQSRQSYH